MSASQVSAEMKGAQEHTPVATFLQAFHMLALSHGLRVAYEYEREL